MQKPPSPHRWGLAHSFRSEREEGCANKVHGAPEGIPRWLGEESPPSPQALGPGAAPAPASLTHARAPPGAHVQAVAAVATAVVGAASVHANASAGAARLCLALVHI